MDNAAEIFKAELSAKGIDAEVACVDDAASMNTRFVVQTTVNGERERLFQNISSRELSRSNGDGEKLVRMYAQELASYVLDQEREYIQWGDRYAYVNFRNNPSAECIECGAEAELPGHFAPSMVHAEASVPQPSVQKYTDFPRGKVMMLMLGKLRNECEPGCPNSRRPSARSFGF